MPTLRPFRDYDEKDVINVYTVSGNYPINKGTFVKLANSGLRLDLPDVHDMIGSYGDFAPSNVTAQRYGVISRVVPCTAQTDVPVGMMLFDCRELDENGEQLKYRPRKAAEMEAVLTGQACPLVTRGIFAYSGVETGNGLQGVVQAGQKLYLSSTAALTATPWVASSWVINYSGLATYTGTISGDPIAVALGATDSSNVTVIRLGL